MSGIKKLVSRVSRTNVYLTACIIALAIFAASSLSTHHAHASVDPATTAAAIHKPVVFTHKISVAELSELLTYPARVEPKIRASVVAETDGVVTKIMAPLGSTVRAGAPLLVIRNSDPIYQYAPMIVPSAVEGVVSHVEITEGSRVARGDKLLLVTDPERARVEVEITAQDLPSIKPGMTAELLLAGPQAVPIHLKVRGISPFVDPTTGTASCELELAPDKAAGKTAPRLPPLGLIGRVAFRVNQRQGILIADSALTYRGKDPYVRLVIDGKAKLVSVILGRKEAGAVEILKGLHAGDEVIERASGFVADGEAVEVEPNGQQTQGQG